MFPDLENFRIAKLVGFRRVFAHAAPIFFERGVANLETKEFSSLSVEPCEGESLVVTVFEIKTTEVKLVSLSLMPKLGKAGSLQSRQAIVHSLVHIESWAVDLSWDIIARIGKQEKMPREFFTDFVKVAQDEGRHFSMLTARLEEIGSSSHSQKLLLHQI